MLLLLCRDAPNDVAEDEDRVRPRLRGEIGPAVSAVVDLVAYAYGWLSGIEPLRGDVVGLLSVGTGLVVVATVVAVSCAPGEANAEGCVESPAAALVAA